MYYTYISKKQIGVIFTEGNKMERPATVEERRQKHDMYKAYEIDYHNRSYLLGTFKTVKEAQKAEREALRRSHGEFPTFTTHESACVTVNGKLL